MPISNHNHPLVVHDDHHHTQRDRHLAYLGWVRYLARSRLVTGGAIYLQTSSRTIELVDIPLAGYSCGMFTVTLWPLFLGILFGWVLVKFWGRSRRLFGAAHITSSSLQQPVFSFLLEPSKRRTSHEQDTVHFGVLSFSSAAVVWRGHYNNITTHQIDMRDKHTARWWRTR